MGCGGERFLHFIFLNESENLDFDANMLFLLRIEKYENELVCVMLTGIRLRYCTYGRTIGVDCSHVGF